MPTSPDENHSLTEATKPRFDLSDGGLNLLMARLVAGMDMDNRPVVQGLFVTPISDYLRDANAVIKLLGTDWDLRVRNGICRVTYYRPSEEYEADSNTFCRAACLALLKAAGVSITE